MSVGHGQFAASGGRQRSHYALLDRGVPIPVPVEQADRGFAALLVTAGSNALEVRPVHTVVLFGSSSARVVPDAEAQHSRRGDSGRLLQRFIAGRVLGAFHSRRTPAGRAGNAVLAPALASVGRGMKAARRFASAP